MEAKAATTTLTARQIEVLRLLVEHGLARKQIARRLGLRICTVDSHFLHMYGRAGVSDETQLVLWALRRGVISLALMVA